MFFKNRKKSKDVLQLPESAPTNRPVDPYIAEILGQIAQQEVSEQKSFYDEVIKRKRAIESYNKNFLKEAVSKGVPSDKLPALVADAMNVGELPRILPGMQFRGSGFFLQLLDGVVPPEKLKVSVYFDEEGAFTGGRIESSNDPFKDVHYEGLVTSSTHKLPQLRPSPFDKLPFDVDELAKIDAHMPIGYNPDSDTLL